MNKKLAGAATVVAGIAASVLTSCDAEKEGLKVFSDQGLTLLRPARDYVVVGGLVIQSPGGSPTYVDPLDPVRADSTSSFTSVIYDAAKTQSVSFAVAAQLVDKMLPVSIGLSVGGDRNVHLSQIDAPGSRVKIPEITALIRMPKTQEFLFDQVKGGAKAFVIQEVYTANSLSLTSDSGVALDVSLRDGKVKKCEDVSDKSAKPPTESTSVPKVPADAAPKPAEDTKEPTESPVPAEATNGPTSTGSSSSTPIAPHATNSDPASPPTSSPESAAPSPDGKPPAPKVSVGVTVCMASDYTLKFKTNDRLPFAVRLMEVVPIAKAGDKSLMVKLGTFRFPSTLGDSDLEKMTYVDKSNPVISSLERGPIQPSR